MPKGAQGLTKAAHGHPRTAQGRPKAAKGFSGENLQNLSNLGILGHRLVHTNLCPKMPKDAQGRPRLPKAAQGLTKATHGRPWRLH